MKANELMLGSYIASDYGCNKPVIYCVDKLEDDYIRGSELDDPSYLYEHEEHFDPILITPEILARLGFKRALHFTRLVDVFTIKRNGKEFDYDLYNEKAGIQFQKLNVIISDERRRLQIRSSDSKSNVACW